MPYHARVAAIPALALDDVPRLEVTPADVLGLDDAVVVTHRDQRSL